MEMNRDGLKFLHWNRYTWYFGKRILLRCLFLNCFIPFGFSLPKQQSGWVMAGNLFS